MGDLVSGALATLCILEEILITLSSELRRSWI